MWSIADAPMVADNLLPVMPYRPAAEMNQQILAVGIGDHAEAVDGRVQAPADNAPSSAGDTVTIRRFAGFFDEFFGYTLIGRNRRFFLPLQLVSGRAWTRMDGSEQWRWRRERT